MSDAGRGLQAPTVSSPFMRKHIVQQLLVGDLADLADEGLYQLLPSVSKLHGAKKKELRAQKASKAKKHMLNSSLRKSQSRSVFVPDQSALCYVTMEQGLVRQLKQAHAEGQLVQALEQEVFPELNLRSYLDCRSDLALPTIRHILSGRPTDEAWELDQSLTKALKTRRTSTGKKKTAVTNNGKHAPALAPRKPLQGHPHPWLLPMEWED